MTLLDAFGLIFTGIWAFITSPLLMFLIGAFLAIIGVILTLSAIFVPHVNRSELGERLFTAVAGPLIAVLGTAMLMWVATSSSSPFTWGV